MKKVAILGSTGSIGRSALAALSNLRGYGLYAIAANREIELLRSQIKEYAPERAVLSDSVSVSGGNQGPGGITIETGQESLLDIVRSPEVSVVLNGISGIDGLLPTIEALKAGKRVATANK